MRLLLLMSFVLLAACQAVGGSNTAGDAAWLEWVDRQLSISDGHGHGPDYGSQEWCDAVHFKLYGERPSAPTPCDKAWMEETDKAIKKRQA